MSALSRVTFASLAMFTCGGWRLAAAVKIGDKCGISGSELLSPDFEGRFTVSGPGCSIGSEAECYCAPVLGDNQPLSEWAVQCNSDATGAVPFGPIDNKVCPTNIPVPAGFKGQNPDCDTGVHPTGLKGDPSCPYSNCASGGNSSAVCGCVDLQMYQMGEGMKWYCLHSTCDCDLKLATSRGAPTPSPTSSATLVSSMKSVLVLHIASCMTLFAAWNQ